MCPCFDVPMLLTIVSNWAAAAATTFSPCEVVFVLDGTDRLGIGGVCCVKLCTECDANWWCIWCDGDNDIGTGWKADSWWKFCNWNWWYDGILLLCPNIGWYCELDEGTCGGKFGRNRSEPNDTNFDVFSIFCIVVDWRLNGLIGCAIVYDFSGKMLFSRDHKSSIVYRSHFVARCTFSGFGFSYVLSHSMHL